MFCFETRYMTPRNQKSSVVKSYQGTDAAVGVGLSEVAKAGGSKPVLGHQ